MGILQNKIDFSLIITVKNANPNGDPLSGNRPRESYDGFGEISDICIKRKIRNRLQDMGEKIFVQSDDRCDDGCDSLRARAENNEELKAISKGKIPPVTLMQQLLVKNGSTSEASVRFLLLRAILFR